VNPLAPFLREIRDPRRPYLVDHPLLTILTIVILSMFCGADGWEEMHAWAVCKQEWLATFLDLSHGVPSPDTLRRVVAALLPGPFRKAFVAWAKTLVASTEGKLIAIDGKTARGSTNEAGDVLHVVRAWVMQNALVLGQVATDAKSNEITAIPELLKLLSLRGATVTVDAMGTQREIALDILDKNAHYVMALKDNQPTIHTEAQVELGTKTEPRRPTASFHKTEDRGHGRTEVRRVWVTSKLDHLATLITWPGIQTLIRIESERCVEGKTSFEDRYYLSSRVLTAKEAGEMVRGHWSIENTCHWTLDVVFGEDDARVREGHAPENLGLIRSLILNVFKRDTTKTSLKRKAKLCGWDHDFMLRMVRSIF
jgi:predicted transposase YbfD/YdcC